MPIYLSRADKWVQRTAHGCNSATYREPDLRLPDRLETDLREEDFLAVPFFATDFREAALREPAFFGADLRAGERRVPPLRGDLVLVVDLFAAPFFEALFFVLLRDVFLEAVVPLRAAFFRGTLAPASRASESPIAIACLRLVTFLPLRPDFNFPFFISCMALSTLSCDFLAYFAISGYFPHQ